jgi:TolB-like protein
MKNLIKKPAAAVLAVFFSLFLFVSLITGQDQSTVVDKLGEAFKMYSELEFEKGLEIADKLLQRDEINLRDSIAIYAVKSMLLYGKGDEYITKSYKYLEMMANLGPCAIQLPYDFWPQELRNQWFRIAQGKSALVCPEEGDREIKTIAIMEFDNYSVGKFQEELGFVTKGLADFFEADFSKVTNLKVVERDKVAYILKEIELTKEGMVEASTAVRVGKMLGAQIMVFGSVAQLDDRKARMLVKAVKVETSEIIASVEKEGKPDYFKMEKELVKELSEKLDLTLTDETTALIDQSGTESTDAATLYSRGLYYMDKYDYAKAFDYFKQAYEKDNTFAEAKKKMDIYRPLVS